MHDLVQVYNENVLVVPSILLALVIGFYFGNKEENSRTALARSELLSRTAPLSPIKRRTFSFEAAAEDLNEGNYARQFVSLQRLSSSAELAQHKLDAELYIVKQVQIKLSPDQHVGSHALLRRVRQLSLLQCKFLIRYVTCWAEWASVPTTETAVCIQVHIQMEYCPGQSLRQWLGLREVDDIQEGARVAVQLFKGLHDIHSKGIVHGNLSASSVFLDPDGTVKIGGFAMHGAFECHDDLYSAGVILRDLASQSAEHFPRWHELTRALTAQDPMTRPSASQALAFILSW